MIESSKSPVEMASDGNIAVKLQLQCPQCRTNLKNSLEDTLILRRAKTFEKLLKANDSELSASELRQKHSLGERKLAKALGEAQSKYNKFSLIRKASSDSEEGIEVVDPYEIESSGSFISTSSEPSKRTTIDTSLFSGLHYFMSDEEQRFVVELMTYGEVNKLAQAAQILKGVANISRKGGVPNSTIYKKSGNSGRASDIENLVNRRNHNSQHTHNTAMLRNGQFRTSRPSARSSAGAVGRAFAMGRTEKDRKERACLEEMERLKRFHPLPARMPNFVVFTSNSWRNSSPYDYSFPLQFVDDEWDGTIADAFAKVHVNRRATVFKRQSSNAEGVNNVLNAGNCDNTHGAHSTISEPVKRVVISKVKNEAGRQGAQSGDVVTHLNGEIFQGNAEDLRAAIVEYGTMSNNSDLTFTLNAEASTAEALKLRAVILDSFS